MNPSRRDGRIGPTGAALILVGVILVAVFVTATTFAGSFKSSVPVTLTSDRSGLVMESGGKVKLRGVQVGRVEQVQGGGANVALQLQLDPGQIEYIPANVRARIRATTAFGAKYVDLVYPPDPSPQRIAAGAVIRSENVSTEVNTVFQNLTDVLHDIDPAKLNGILSALAEGVRGQGPVIGEATTAANDVLLAVNPRAELIREDWQALGRFGDTYGGAAADLLKVLRAATTTSATIVDHAGDLDRLLVSTIGFADAGTNLLGPSKGDLISSIKALEPTTALVHEYDPEYTCLLLGAKWVLDNNGYAAGGGNGSTFVGDAAVLLGDDPYRYPDNLPITGAKGGPGGKPGCGSLPDPTKQYPVRYLVTNTGWGTGLDMRPNPGIGFPGYANYLPTTRGTPEAPSIRHPGDPAPGPVAYPGAPPYGAPMYASDGTPLFPGLPPAPPPGAPREPGPPPPGSEPFISPFPATLQPTPAPSPPPAEGVTPSP